MRILSRGSIAFLLFWAVAGAQDGSPSNQADGGARPDIEIPTPDRLIRLQEQVKNANPDGAAMETGGLFEESSPGPVPGDVLEPVPGESPEGLEATFEPAPESAPRQAPVPDTVEFERVDPYAREGGFPPRLTYFSNEAKKNQPSLSFLHHRGRSSSVIGRIGLIPQVEQKMNAQLPATEKPKAEKPERSQPPAKPQSRGIDPEIRQRPARSSGRIPPPSLDWLTRPTVTANPVDSPPGPRAAAPDGTGDEFLLEGNLRSVLRKPLESLTARLGETPSVTVRKPSHHKVHRTSQRSLPPQAATPVARAKPISP